MKEPNERDESQPYDDELKNEDEFEEGASPNESGLEQPDEPPDWLVETVGLSDQSRQSPSPEENPLDEDDSAGEDPQSSPLGGVEFPAWLSGGASQDEEDEEEDILETLVGPAASLESITQDAEPTGDASAQASTTAEKALGALLDETPDEQDQEPAEFEDELKWLEEIAASHEASDDAPFGSEFDENTMVPFPENEYLPDWLKDSATSDVADFEEHPEPASFDETPEPANVVSETPERADDEFLDWLSDPGFDERSSTSVEGSEDIDWFNQIVSGDESAIDQLLASQGIDLDSVQESSSAVQDDDEPSWLEAMDDIPASIDETIVGKTYIVDEVRAIPPVELEEEFIPDEFAAEEFAPDADQEEVPTDPEEAMAWLEQLAQKENEGDEFIEKTLESEVEFEYEMDSEEPLSIASSTPAAIPDDPDEAMAWLEQLASEETAPDDDLWAFEVSDASLELDQESEQEVDEELEAALAAILDIPMPADPEEAMAWLEELALSAEVEPDLEEAVDGILEGLPDELAQERQAYKEEIAEGIDTDESPLDADELELAAVIAAAEMLDLGSDELDEDQSAEVEPRTEGDELIDELLDESAFGAIDETLPGTMVSEAYVEDESDLEPSSFDDDLLEAILPEMTFPEMESDGDDEIDESRFDSIDATIAGTAAAAALAADEFLREDLEEEAEAVGEEKSEQFTAGTEASQEDQDETDEEDLEWLDDLEEANVTGWLMAEQALLAKDKEAEDEYDLMAQEPATPPSQEEVSPEQFLARYQFDDRGIEGLGEAQEALQRGRFDEALEAYSALIEKGEALPYVITDLELVSDVTGKRSDFMKLLGDSYSRNGQLQKAIEVYRQALNNL